MSNTIYRIFVEKNTPYDIEAKGLLKNLTRRALVLGRIVIQSIISILSIGYS